MKVNGGDRTDRCHDDTDRGSRAMFRSSARHAMRRAKSDQDAVKAVMR
jgi:hypothetical protein